MVFELDSGLLQQYGRPPTVDRGKGAFGSFLEGGLKGYRYGAERKDRKDAAAAKAAKDRQEYDRKVRENQEDQAQRKTDNELAAKKEQRLKNSAEETKRHNEELERLAQEEGVRAATRSRERTAKHNLALKMDEINLNSKESTVKSENITDEIKNDIRTKNPTLSQEELNIEYYSRLITDPRMKDVLQSEKDAAHAAIATGPEALQNAALLQSLEVQALMAAGAHGDQPTMRKLVSSVFKVPLGDVLEAEKDLGTDPSEFDDVVWGTIQATHPDGTKYPQERKPIKWAEYIDNLNNPQLSNRLLAFTKTQGQIAVVSSRREKEKKVAEWRAELGATQAALEESARDATEQELSTMETEINNLNPEVKVGLSVDSYNAAVVKAVKQASYYTLELQIPNHIAIEEAAEDLSMKFSMSEEAFFKWWTKKKGNLEKYYRKDIKEGKIKGPDITTKTKAKGEAPSKAERIRKQVLNSEKKLVWIELSEDGTHWVEE